ncbi:PQQ-dependent sugar dehydrogenase [Azospirillum sp. SYSU D00513]|uniref:PQQ-dependent sugar dehydrogenase n=1 Tax=Azospirillum sp. SYSU D00513 TaxID=2812561 RepID=UPI001A965812|nr:PQQ-dependent sugar dehydrogenase [Azospirillum sp. SYSU D00513]
MRSILIFPASAVLAVISIPAFAQFEKELPQGTKSVQTQIGPIEVRKIAGGLEKPWGIDFLPDGRALITEKAGRLRILKLDGSLSGPLNGTPEVYSEGQGGLMDVAVDPQFAQNRIVYLSFAEPGEGGAGTALGRGTLADDRIENFRVIFRQTPKVTGSNHFGNRIVFSPNGHIFLTLGERFKFAPAQDLSNTLGTVVRLNRDGTIPKDNPFHGDPKADDAVWSYGHRNIEAAASHPQTGALWVAEMGPLGGDELNQLQPGKNYGWPEVSWGRHYNGRDIPDPPTRPEFADAAMHWTPVISPSGMHFYTGNLITGWEGSALIGSLSGTALVRVAIDGNRVREAERIPLGARVRDVTQGPDGTIHVITDEADGAVWQITPMDSGNQANKD